MNAVHVIAPYKCLDQRMFGDPRVGLGTELFVNGADSVTDRSVAGIPNAHRASR